MKYGLLGIFTIGLLAAWVWVARIPSPKVMTPSSLLPTAIPSQKISSAPTIQTSTPPEETAKIHLLEEILALKNDNDPRLDREFLNLTEKTKSLLREKYRSLPDEKRNEKGTIVFLLGKNLKDVDDFQFLETVLKDPPCYNLLNCQASVGAPDSGHEAMGSEITLAYPQIVSLKAVEKYLADKESNPNHADLAYRVIETGKTSPVKVVSTLADNLWDQAKR